MYIQEKKNRDGRITYSLPCYHSLTCANDGRLELVCPMCRKAYRRVGLGAEWHEVVQAALQQLRIGG